MTKTLNEKAWEEFEEFAKKTRTGEEDRLKELGLNARDENGGLKTMSEVIEEVGGFIDD